MLNGCWSPNGSVRGVVPPQVENAGEIALEHNLGLTSDTIAGLVQVPCIERNAIGAVKAISDSGIAVRGDGDHFVSLDQVIKTMRDTGQDMQEKYKETARGGLAVNVIQVPVNLTESEAKVPSQTMDFVSRDQFPLEQIKTSFT